ncbi:MAG: hypothetical protein M1358_08445 [Chloroflexi bacterium]|nr:hypothetical protein [Chloroflexota bacterium]
MGGNYRICNATAMRQGTEDVLWDGLWRRGTRHKFPELLKRYEELAPRIKEFLQAKVVFVAATDCDRVLRRRIEGAIAAALRSDSIASSLLPSDVRYRTRMSRETPVEVRIESDHQIIGFPRYITA